MLSHADPRQEEPSAFSWESFAIEMARHACVIEDRPLADSDDDEVIEALSPAEVAPIIALNRS